MGCNVKAVTGLTLVVHSDEAAFYTETKLTLFGSQAGKADVLLQSCAATARMMVYMKVTLLFYIT